MSQVGIEGLKGIPNSTAAASEDFAIIAEKILTTYMILTAGFMDERGDYSLHHPKAQIDENYILFKLYLDEVFYNLTDRKSVV